MPTSSQGHSFGGLSGLTNVKYKTSRVDPTDSKNRIDASTLDLADGSDRVYVDGLPDAGPGSDGGITSTVTASGLSATQPTVGSTYDGYKCTESEIEYAVGELVKWTASFTAV